jgi:ubiquinone/menaquinone biosynthesis C-methylase UbiE
MQSNVNTMSEARELAYLYDLYIVPGWREAFDKIVDEEIELPKEGKFLEAQCGTGGFAIDMAIRGGAKTEVIGVDSNLERLVLARSKAGIKKMDRVKFQQGVLTDLDFRNGEFDLVIGDASMTPPAELPAALDELIRVAKKGATVVMKLTTRGSFDEFFSIYWEALYNLNLLEYVPQLERLITERLTVGDAEQMAVDAGLKQVRSLTRKERFDYGSGNEFFESPLIGSFFIDDWFALLPDMQSRRLVQQQIVEIIEEERHKMDFDVSIKATLLIGRK